MGPSATARRRRVRSRSPNVERAGVALLAASIVGSALAFGAQATSALVVVSILAVAAALLVRPAATPRATWLLLALATYTLFQLAPLPLSLLERLSPRSAAIWRGTYRLLGVDYRWATLSVDPAGTALEALKWFAYACVFSAACGVRARRGASSVALLVFFSAGLVCAVTLAHGFLDAPRIYGFYRPVDPSPWLRGPFVNGNNLAGYVNLGLFAGIGLWLAPPGKLPTAPLALAVPLMVVQVLLSGSRAGIGTLVLGGLMVGYFVVRQRQLAPKRVAAASAAALVLGVVGALFVGGSRFWQTVSDLETRAKIYAWGWSLDLIRDFPVFGVGRGAFETAFEPYRKPFERNWTMVFPHAENFLLEWAADWGLPVALATLAGFVAVSRKPFSRATRDPLASGLVAGLTAITLQNLFDLGFEIFGVFALALVALAALSEPPEATPRHRNLGTTLAACGVAVASVLVVVRGATVVHIERQNTSKAYSAWVRNGARDASALLGSVRRSIMNHPAEAYFPLVGSILVGKTGGDELRWIGRALERSPLDAHVHLRLADLMTARRARRQALLHLRLSALYDVTLRDLALQKAAGLLQSSSDLSSVFPRDLPGSSLLAELCAKTQGEMRVLCWREVLAREPASMTSRRELASALLDALESSGVPCAGETARSCRAEVDRLVTEVTKTTDDWRVSELRARQLAAAGDAGRAAALLLERCPASSEAAPCCERAFELARRSRDMATLGAAADRFASVLCNDTSRCALVHERIARSYAELGAWGLAQRHFSTAANESPTVDRWIQSADAAAHAGSPTLVRVAFERARREGDFNAEQRRRADAIEAMLEEAAPSR